MYQPYSFYGDWGLLNLRRFMVPQTWHSSACSSLPDSSLRPLSVLVGEPIEGEGV